MVNTDDQRVALVLAASRGLGRGSAEALARSGCRIVLCARGKEELEETAKGIRSLGAMVATKLVDVRSNDDIASAVEHAHEVFGGLDALVCNAGGPPPGDFASVSEEDWRTGFELTLMSVVRAVGHAVPLMRARDGGRIVVIGSSSVKKPIPRLVISNVYRPGLLGLVKSLAVELAPEGITVNMVSPGRIQTGRVGRLDQLAAEREGVDVQTIRDRSIASIPMGRYGTPSELGAMVAFLASKDAAYVTGQSVLVDGGMVPTLP
ncbi:MAG: SDR family oxidoreductase [Actinobacteria bacterium]|nr:SDR family oxidoreductase [Actinomycetota bacterium]